MSDAPKEEPVEKKKSPIIKVALMIILFLVVIACSVGGTLVATGYFSKKPVVEGKPGEGSPDAPEHSKPGGSPDKSDGTKDKGDKSNTPQKKPLPKDAQSRFEKSYMDLDEKKPLVSNVANSRKVMQVSISLMTQYDDRVFKNVEKHRATLRSVALDTLRQVVETDFKEPNFRDELSKKIRSVINKELERLENFGGIEEVFFTDFVYQ